MGNNKQLVSTDTGEIVEKQTQDLTTMSWTPEDIQLIRETVAADCTDSEFKLFLYVAKRSGLDPLSKQIYAVKRWNGRLKRKEMVIQTGIDGYRVIAGRKDYAGQDAPEFVHCVLTKRGEEKYEQIKGEKYTEPPVLVSATVTVYRFINGERVPFSHTAYWDEYVQLDKDGKPTQFWRKMPHNQLAKCAEAGALRKAFPNDLAGIYTHEEMQQAENDMPPERKVKDIEYTGNDNDEKGDIEDLPERGVVNLRKRAADGVDALMTVAKERGEDVSQMIDEAIEIFITDDEKRPCPIDKCKPYKLKKFIETWLIPTFRDYKEKMMLQADAQHYQVKAGKIDNTGKTITKG